MRCAFSVERARRRGLQRHVVVKVQHCARLVELGAVETAVFVSRRRLRATVNKVARQRLTHADDAREGQERQHQQPYGVHARPVGGEHHDRGDEQREDEPEFCHAGSGRKGAPTS